MGPSDKDKDKGFKVVDRRGGAAADGAPDKSDVTPPAGLKPGLEIDFTTFVLSLASSALHHLGELQHPEAPERNDLGLAKQTIDILGMLSEKTRGNLSADEARLIEHMLYDLRLKYVEAKKRG